MRAGKPTETDTALQSQALPLCNCSAVCIGRAILVAHARSTLQDHKRKPRFDALFPVGWVLRFKLRFRK